MTTSVGDMSTETALDLSKRAAVDDTFDLKVNVNRSDVDLTVIRTEAAMAKINKTGTVPVGCSFSPGCGRTGNTKGYGDRLASYGIVTIFAKIPRSEWDHTYRDDTIALISWLLSPMGRGRSSGWAALDRSKAGLTSASLGGKISFWWQSQTVG